MIPSLDFYYSPKDELISASNRWAEMNGFYLSTKRSEHDRVILICIRSGLPCINGHVSQRAKHSIKCDCPFKLNGRKQSDGQWKINLTNNTHNHPPIVPVTFR
jgi:hypothetical protein